MLAITPGVAALGREALATIVADVRMHELFSEENDPFGEHDMGTVHHAGQRLFWKIDYYDTNLEFGSPDPADPAVTTRILTIMLASEY
ncbi:DUF3768 domain-containing protein [Sphingomonas sp. PB4P5]|uniref:DUF3768 domain-containing protein n=1 Tax=Parasphingomonas puruogangriensis TaxID=3096155 RepID=UPI002FCB1D94